MRRSCSTAFRILDPLTSFGILASAVLSVGCAGTSPERTIQFVSADRDTAEEEAQAAIAEARATLTLVRRDVDIGGNGDPDDDSGTERVSRPVSGDAYGADLDAGAEAARRQIEGIVMLTRDGERESIDADSSSRQIRHIELEFADDSGTEPDRLSLPSDETFSLPVDEPEISSPFGRRRDPIHGRRRMHRGTDFRGSRGTAVYATASGRVIMGGWCDRGTGNCVVLDHAGTWRSQYFHLSEVHVSPHAWVEQGQHIGDIGSTGRSTGPHLHFQVGQVGGDAVDPMDLIGEPLTP